ncbi:MAG: hypothetical protein H6739_40410 [Alphaproteobacteria bacterium]|nr:hypothetical protein [Alphaproteobacteria bacterium]
MNAKHLLFIARLSLVPVLALTLLPAQAQAGEVEKAEHRRLTEEMKKRASSNAWAGVERSFQELLALQKKGEVLSYQDWYLGAQAARGLGDMAACKERVEGALSVEETEEARSWLDNINANYVMVTLKGGDKDTPHELVIKGMPFAPDQRKAVETAQAAVAEGRNYEGLLPLGGYTYRAGEDERLFTLASGDAPQTVKLGGGTVAQTDPDQPKQQGLAFVGPRLDLGASYLQVGTDSAGSSPVPGGYGELGGRGLVGLEVGITPAIGVSAQVGYHGLFMSPQTSGANMHLGVGRLGAAFRANKLWIGAGGSYALGLQSGGQLSSADLVSACEANNPDGEVNCEMVALGAKHLQGEAPPDTAALKGTSRMGGGDLSISFAFLEIGSSLAGAVTVGGGAYYDTDRLYPWGQLAFTLAPVPARSK